MENSLTPNQMEKIEWCENFCGISKDSIFYTHDELEDEDRINDLIELYCDGYQLILNDSK